MAQKVAAPSATSAVLTMPKPPAGRAEPATVTHTIGVELITAEMRTGNPWLFPEDRFAVVEHCGPLTTVLASDSTNGAGRDIAVRAVRHACERGAVFVPPCRYCGVSTCGQRDVHAEWYRDNETVIRRAATGEVEPGGWPR
jgi:hypothetical protein